ncbi:MAG: thermonuclease family protein [Henriciella sp.]|uniref:thermonuclease family protein n=1 Tax=Henriciella sp. TaxID=1968823 RepID=UPI003C777D9E
MSLLGLALMMGAGCSKGGPLEDMAEGETGRVVRVIDGDALVLDTGQSVRLVGIEAPVLKPRYGDPEPHAEKAARALEDLAMGRRVRLHYPGLTRDRYDRALAHIATADGTGPDYWINLELVRQGHVRVRLYPDTDRGGETLLAAEAEARRERKGLWGLSYYRPAQASALQADGRGFQLVRARLAEKTGLPDEWERKTLCSWALADSALVVDVEFTARALCDIDAGAEVIVRGWIQDQRMELVHPLHLHLVEPEAP